MSKITKDITGFIPKGTDCEFKEYCAKSGAQCLHSGENKKINYHCGYCKSFRIIEKVQNRKLGEKR